MRSAQKLKSSRCPQVTLNAFDAKIEMGAVRYHVMIWEQGWYSGFTPLYAWWQFEMSLLPPSKLLLKHLHCRWVFCFFFKLSSFAQRKVPEAAGAWGSRWLTAPGLELGKCSNVWQDNLWGRLRLSLKAWNPTSLKKSCLIDTRVLVLKVSCQSVHTVMLAAELPSTLGTRLSNRAIPAAVKPAGLRLCESVTVEL